MNLYNPIYNPLDEIDLTMHDDGLPEQIIEDITDRDLLIVEDDRPFLMRLSRAMEQRGFMVRMAESIAKGMELVKDTPPDFAIVDMRLQDGNGLDVIKAIHQVNPNARTIILTGYGNLASAVTAIKSGATDYLSKPADADSIFNALLNAHSHADLPENPMSADRVKWEHIQRVFEMCDRNVSETARRLNMHRRTLQRILAKRAPK